LKKVGAEKVNFLLNMNVPKDFADLRVKFRSEEDWNLMFSGATRSPMETYGEAIFKRNNEFTGR
jgi:hypothetical protein